MRAILFIISFFLLSGQALHAQQAEVDQSLFLYELYVDGEVYLKNNQRSNGQLNLFLPTGEFYFLDDTDGNKEKILDNVEDVHLVKIGSRLFFPSEKGTLEILSSEPQLYVQYKLTMTEKAKNVAFGGTSQLANVKSFTMNSTGTGVSLDPMKMEVKSRYNIYWVEHKGKQKELRSMKQFLKHFANHKEKLQEFIDLKNVDFNDATAMLALFRYACQLGQ